ncbi:MAG: HAMP domain-containing protein [Bryobacterales bacterium]|nr:HAMP domain-containing protein [Bryobacterales bacterium]
MKKRFLYGTAVFFLAILVTLMVWQGSFSFGEYGPSSTVQTFVFWAVSTLVFILMVALAWMLVRTGVKLYIERRKGREGSRLRTKLVAGALALSFLPVIFLFVFAIQVLNRNLDKWFSRPIESIHRNLIEVSNEFDTETRLRAHAVARWLGDHPSTHAYLETGVRPALFNQKLCDDLHLHDVRLRRPDGTVLMVCTAAPPEQPNPRLIAYSANVGEGELTVRARLQLDLAATQQSIESEIAEYAQLIVFRKEARFFYILLLLLLSLFVLYVATWIALFFARQLSGPIAELVEAAKQLRSGNLNHRIETDAIDELGTLVRAFNEMASDLQANERELERRRNFTEAILESIPTGVISLSGERRIQRVNSAFVAMMGAERVARAVRLEDLFSAEDARELHYLLNRARRTGVASGQMELELDRHTLHLSITVAALVGKHTTGWVVVIEDTSELLRAQKSAAWHEVARRIAHEMKNPLTPISLSAERIARQLEKSENAASIPAEVMRILRQCSLTISAEVESVKTLVNEFSQFARFPAAQPVAADLNEVVDGALSVFAGRLEQITLQKNLQTDLPPVMIDRDQIRRVVVNLVDNAAEAMQGCETPMLTVATQLTSSDTVELSIADTGHGIQPEDRDRLFLPYFSTKGRGTGLGLAIVHHILADHGAQIRVEDNHPCGARFLIEIPVHQPQAAAPAVGVAVPRVS